MGKAKQWAIKALMLVVSTGIGLALLELGVRWRYDALMDVNLRHFEQDGRNLPDPDLVFVRKPLMTWEGRLFRDRFVHYVVFRTDENGFRNPPGITEADIAFIGDSFVEAGNVPEEDTFICLAGQQLGLTAVNLGRAHYGPQQELIVMERYAFKYHPKTVVWVLFEGNDVRNADEYFNGKPTEASLPYGPLDRPEARGTVWFDDYELYELAPPPEGGVWRQGATARFNDNAFLRAHVRGGNLLKNGSFEEGTNGLAFWLGQEIPASADILQDTETIPVHGRCSFRVHLPGDVPLWLRQHVNVTPGTQYLLKGWIKTENLGGGAYLAVGEPGSRPDKFLRRGVRVCGTQDWTERGLVFTVPEELNRIDVYLQRRTKPPVIAPISSRLRLVQLLRTTYEYYRFSPVGRWGMRGQYRLASGETIDVGFQYTYDPNVITEYPDGWRETQRCLAEGLHMCQENGVRLIVVYIPIKLRVEGPFTTLLPKSDEERETWLPGGQWERDGDFAHAVAAYCQEIGCEFIDARPALMERAKTGHRVYSARFDSHLDTEGHEVVAALVAEKLRTP